MGKRQGSPSEGTWSPSHLLTLFPAPIKIQFLIKSVWDQEHNQECTKLALNFNSFYFQNKGKWSVFKVHMKKASVFLGVCMSVLWFRNRGIRLTANPNEIQNKYSLLYVSAPLIPLKQSWPIFYWKVCKETETAQRAPSELHIPFPPPHLPGPTGFARETRLCQAVSGFARQTHNALNQKESQNEGKEVHRGVVYFFSTVVLLKHLNQLNSLYMTSNSVCFWWTLNHILKKFLKNLKFYFTTFAIIASRILYWQ